MQSQELEKNILLILEEIKGRNIIDIDVQKRSQVTDKMIIASANSSTHARAIASKIKKELKGKAKIISIEGIDSCQWILIDFGNIILHIMQDEMREFYKLEELWQSKK